MFKFVILGIIIFVVIGMFGAIRIFVLNQSPTKTKSPNINNSSLSTGSNGDKLADLENKMEVLRKQVGKMDSSLSKSTQTTNTTTNTTASNASVETRLENLEKAIAQIQVKLSQSPTSTTSTPTTTVSKIPAYIFSLGAMSSTNELDWVTQTTPTITINPSDYPGATSFQLEGYLSTYQGNGTAYARLFNSNTGTAVSGSDISTTSENPTWVSSSNFTLPSGKITYSFQLKTSTGYTATLENARLKVNF